MSIGPGARVGGYLIERVLGVGGMGTVYLARHPQLPRHDALKVLSTQYSQNPEYRARFAREANLAAALDHPNIVSIHTRGEERGQLWIAMQYVNGIDAADAQARFPQSMSPWRALHIVTEVGRGLDHAHRRGLLHRDIKPANFLLSTGDDGEERVLLTDFGVAKSTDDTIELTQAGDLVATIAYASPEQLSGHRLDHRTDIYSLACSFFRLATGQNPYPGAQPAPVMVGHLHEPPPLASAVVPALPAAVDQVLAVAMAKNPAERFESCHAFTAALKSALESGVSSLDQHTTPQHGRAGRAPHSPSTAKHSARKRVWMISAGAATVLAVAAGVGIWVGQGETTAANTGSTTSATPSAPKNIADARAQNPAFSGKSIVIVDITGRSGDFSTMDVQLSPSAQAQFLSDLGFVYNARFVRKGDEPAPRPMSTELARELHDLKSGYLLLARSDSDAGGGSLRNLPDWMATANSTIVVLDDPSAVAALRQWSERSEGLLLEKLLPALSKTVK